MSMFDKWKLIDVKYIDMYHFQIYEGKFQNMEELEMNNKELFAYANISNFDSKSFAESEVRVYPFSYEDMYDPEAFEVNATRYEAYFKRCILEYIHKAEEYVSILCGFVYKHGKDDLSAWSVDLSKEDRETIEKILAKYETEGCSTRNVYDSKFSEVF